jgi:hypothetical protein
MHEWIFLSVATVGAAAFALYLARRVSTIPAPWLSNEKSL